MCLLSVVYRQLPGCPILMLANREESPLRLALPPRLVSCHGTRAAWMGGIDQQARGTWLGMNQSGIVVAVSNRDKVNEPSAPRSRGLLVRDLLECVSAEAALETAYRELRTDAYAGCNILVLTGEEGVVFEAGDEFKTNPLKPGIHTIANHSLNDLSDGRIDRVQTELSRVVNKEDRLGELIVAARRICGLHAVDRKPAICQHDSDDVARRQTVSSSIIAVTDDVAESQYHYAAGRPCITPFVDYSQMARELRSKKPCQSVYQSLPHRMYLKGPWQYEWLSREGSPKSEAGSIDHTGTGKVKMPASWQACFGSVLGRVRFRRRFHRPSNLEPHERVFVVFDGVGGAADVKVNGAEMGSIFNASEPVSFDVTNVLETSNELVVDIEFDSNSADEGAGGLWAPVAIEVRAGTKSK